MVQNYTDISYLVEKYEKDREEAAAKERASWQKEVEPPKTSDEVLKMQEAVEHEPSQEVRPYLQPRQEVVKVPEDLRKMGVSETPTTKFPSFQDVHLPISDEKVLLGLKQPVTSSFRWLAELAVYILKQAHIALKVIHGHVKRVMKG